MRLGISSAVAPDADLEALVRACARRGLSALELRPGDGHRLETDGVATDAAAARFHAVASGVEVVGLRAEVAADIAALARVSASLGAPVIVDGDDPLEARLGRAHELVGAGTAVLVGVSGPAGGWLRTLTNAEIGFAWKIDADTPDPAADFDAMLRVDTLPASVMLAGGGGPEAALVEGRGVGDLMARMALARYSGPLILAPGSSLYRVAWAAWLGRRGGWGCGSKAEDRSTVRLTSDTTGGIQ